MEVHLIGKPSLDIYGWWTFCQQVGLDAGQTYYVQTQDGPSAGEQIVENAGRLCYMSFGKGRKTNKEFIANIIAQKHFSVLEHANYTFIFTGVSRSLTHELVRHRHFSFSQLSQRYVDHSDTKFICPPEVAEIGKLGEWNELMDSIRDFYKDVHKALVGEHEPGDTATKKALRTVARAILPNATATNICVTGNARTWREFIEKRATPAADPEIRELAIRVRDVLASQAPALFGDLA